MTIYICPDCGHMPAEHGPEGCTALSRAAATSPNPAVRSGQVEISGGRCGCCAMLNDELAGPAATNIPGAGAQEAKRERVDYASPANVAPPASSSTTQGGQPMSFDIENYGPGQRMEGTIATSEVKAHLWVNKIPFEVSGVPQRRAKPPQFMVARPDGTMPPDSQWWIPLRVLEYRNDGSGQFSYRLQADGEGGQEVVEHVLTLDAAEWRDQQMNALSQYLQTAGRAGPFRLDKGQQSGKGAPPWVLKNWKPEDAGYAPSRPAPAPVAAPVSSPPPVAPPQAPPPPPQAPPAPPAPPPPPADPYQYTNRYDGVKLRWKEGMADWEVVPAAGPAIVHAQPLAPVRTVVGLNPGDRMEGAARTVVEQADGTKIRQVHYQGDGVVQTPQGVMTQVASGEEPRTRQEAITGASQTASMTPGALGVEEPAPVPPGPSPAPTAASQQSVIRAAYDAKSVVLVTLICDHPDHTDNEGQPARISMQAFYDPSVDMWKQTHNCPGAKRVRILNATAAVKAAAGVA